MAAVVMHRFSVLAAPSVRSQGTVLGGVFTKSEKTEVVLDTPEQLKLFDEAEKQADLAVLTTGNTQVAGHKRKPKRTHEELAQNFPMDDMVYGKCGSESCSSRLYDLPQLLLSGAADAYCLWEILQYHASLPIREGLFRQRSKTVPDHYGQLDGLRS